MSGAATTSEGQAELGEAHAEAAVAVAEARADAAEAVAETQQAAAEAQAEAAVEIARAEADAAVAIAGVAAAGDGRLGGVEERCRWLEEGLAAHEEMLLRLAEMITILTSPEIPSPISTTQPSPAGEARKPTTPGEGEVAVRAERAPRKLRFL